MSSKKSLEQNVLEELERTGYPTEIVSASIMQQRNWAVIHNPSYLDDSESQSREFDIRAYRRISFKVAGIDFTVGYYLITECKKSEKPWVFFTTPERHDDSRLGNAIKWSLATRQVFTDNSHPESLVSDDDLRKFHHYFQQQHLARTFHEPLKGQEKSGHSQMIYSAVMSAIKATLFHYNDRRIENWLRVYYPVIVFSGNLFEARVDANKKIDLLPTQYLQLSFHYIVPHKSSVYRHSVWDNHHEFIVDIVHEDYLNQFLSDFEDEHGTLSKHLQDVIK